MPQHPRLALLVTLSLLAACGCNNHVKLKPMPVIYAPGRVDLSTLIPESKRGSDLQVFYATNRSPKGPMEKREYGNGVDATLHLGAATVRMSDDNANPSFKLGAAHELADPQAFYEAIEQQLAVSPNHEVNIYVHGFKTWFTWEVEVLAKLAHCSGRRGAMICFAWPARQSLYLYGSDVERGRESAHHLADLLENIAAHTNAEHINVLAYSCGATVATEALLQLRQRHPDTTQEQLAKRFRIGNVIYAASDIDMTTFASEQIQRLKEVSQNVVIYISDNDAALGWAKMISGASRLGRPDTSKFTKEQQEQAAKEPKVQIVDVTDVPGAHNIGGLRGHGYWYANDWIMTDLLVTFRWQITPDQRGLYRKPGKARWFFPKDYPQKVTAAVQTLALPISAPTTATSRR